MGIERILIVKLADLGDVLLTEPAIRSLRQAYPGARIDVLTTPAAAPLIQMFDLDLGVVTFHKHDYDQLNLLAAAKSATHLGSFAARLRGGGYDALALLHHLTTPGGAMKFRALAGAVGAPVVAGLDNGRGSFLTHRAADLGFGTFHVTDDMRRVVAAIGGAEVDPAPRLPVPEQSGESLPAGVSSRYGLIFPVTGPFAPGRNWPSESFGDVASLLIERGIQPVIAGASDASEAARIIKAVEPKSLDITGMTTLKQLASLVCGSEVTITGDSFPGHLAVAVGAPVVSIFGPSNHHAWAPYGAVEPGASGAGTACIIRNDVPCSPCLYTGFRLGRRNGCASRVCLTRITPYHVMRGVDAVIGNRA